MITRLEVRVAMEGKSYKASMATGKAKEIDKRLCYDYAEALQFTR